MKKIVLLGTILFVLGLTSARAQCPLIASIDTTATVIMAMPNGNKTLLGDSLLLQDTGTYRITAVVNNSDTFSLPLKITGNEELVKLWLNSHSDNIPKTFISIENHLGSLDSVDMKYSHYERNGDVIGPYFKIRNNSHDTICGYRHPDFLWGWLEVLENGKSVNILYGIIDVNCIGDGPLLPNSTKTATIGTWGLPVSVGNYRFHILLSTKPQKHGISLTHQTVTRDWYTSVQSWHHLTCDFEIKSD